MKNVTILCAVLFGLLPAAGSPLLAGEAIAEREDLECIACHLESEEANLLLTDQGKYYNLMGTLEGFELVMERFGECTYCHVPEAGSEALTREGLRFQWMMEDMAGLREWLDEMHPKPADDAPPDVSTSDEGSETGG